MKYIVSSKYNTGDKIIDKIAVSDLKECFRIVKPGDQIYLVDEVYYGKFTLSVNDIMILGTDNSVIAYDAYHSLKIRSCDGGDGEKVYGTTGSATFTVKPQAANLKMYNVTVVNSHKRDKAESNQAVAFKTEASNGYYESCHFTSLQDTLYIDNNDNVFKNCSITGDVDFIFGKGNAILDECSILANTKYNMAYIVAPDTYQTNCYGLLLKNCNIQIEGDNPCYLGRPWYDTGAKEKVIPRCMFYECTFPEKLHLNFVKMRDTNPDDYEMYFYECSIGGSKVSNVYDEKIIDFYKKIYETRK